MSHRNGGGLHKSGRFQKSTNQRSRAARRARRGHGSAKLIEHLEDRRLLSATLNTSQSLMVFNAVKKSAVSPTQTLTISNTGDATLSLTGLTLVADPTAASADQADFAILNAASMPSSLAPGQSFGVQLDYAAPAVGINAAILNIASSDPANPLEQVSLHGIGTAGLGGTSQPSLERILTAYDIPTNVGETDPNNALYPNPPAAGSQEVNLQRLVKSGTGAVTIQVLASFTASGATPYTLGYYTPGSPDARTQLFYTPSSQYQTTNVQPQGATSFDPGAAEFGLYFVSNIQDNGHNRIGYSEDALNTFDTTNNRKFRFFPNETADGTIIPNSYIVTSTEWQSPGGYDFTNIVAIINNVKPAPDIAAASPVLTLQNPNYLPGSNTLLFNRIQNPNTASAIPCTTPTR